MLERLKELMNFTFLNMSIGNILILLFMLYIVFVFYKFKTKEIGYTTGYYSFGEKVLRRCMIFVTFLIILFTILYCLDIRDVDGNKLNGHIILFSFIGYLCALLYLYYGYKRVYFNNNEIIVKTLFKGEKIYYWDDIIRVINKKNDMIIVYTNSGKFIFDSEFDNSKKFIKILEEKNILIEHK